MAGAFVASILGNSRPKWWGETPPYRPILTYTPQFPKRRNAASALFSKFLSQPCKPAAKLRNFDLSTGNPQAFPKGYPQEIDITFNIFLVRSQDQMPTLIQRKRANDEIARSDQTLSSGTQRLLGAGAGKGRQRPIFARIAAVQIAANQPNQDAGRNNGFSFRDHLAGRQRINLCVGRF